MERHRCKLCFRKFANGRALGGHMRSHMLNHHHPISSKPDPQTRTRISSCETVSETETPPPSSVSNFQSSSTDSEHEDEEEIEPTGSSSLVTLQDRESETESFRKNNQPTRKRRSKRILHKPSSYSTSSDFHYFDHQQHCKKSSGSSAADVEADPPGSSITEVTSEEDLAFCLMMMSRDTWDSSDGTATKTTATATATKKMKMKMKYKCDTCNKGFKSYQALGGHRASHMKIRALDSEQEHEHHRDDNGSDSRMVVVKKVHQCPICCRVFASGQALGGHKRSHVLVSNESDNLLSRKKKIIISNSTTNESLIDLNLPAPLEDEGGDDSAVSDVHF